jgi:DNA-binding MarR family transcriptional regulator
VTALELARFIADVAPTTGPSVSSIGVMDLAIMLALSGGHMSVKEIQRALGVSVAVAVDHLDGLQGMGYVVESVNISDRRQRLSSLTPKGMQALRRARRPILTPTDT